MKKNLLFSEFETDGQLGAKFCWPDWEGEVPVVGDVVLNYSKEKGESERFIVVDRWLCNLQPDQVRFRVERYENFLDCGMYI